MVEPNLNISNIPVHNPNPHRLRNFSFGKFLGMFSIGCNENLVWTINHFSSKPGRAKSQKNVMLSSDMLGSVVRSSVPSRFPPRFHDRPATIATDARHKNVYTTDRRTLHRGGKKCSSSCGYGSYLIRSVRQMQQRLPEGSLVFLRLKSFQNRPEGEGHIERGEGRSGRRGRGLSAIRQSNVCARSGSGPKPIPTQRAVERRRRTRSPSTEQSQSTRITQYRHPLAFQERARPGRRPPTREDAGRQKHQRSRLRVLAPRSTPKRPPTVRNA